MCGIAGIFCYDSDAPPVDKEALLKIRESMRNRGPDGAGLWMSSDDRIGFGHRRLSIIDLSNAGAQPMIDPCTNNVIVFNGEIYNYKFLRQELIEQGCSFKSTSDTEVLLHLYRRHGIDFLDKLRGMYALALWDARDCTLTLARDPLGIKPLYYSNDGKKITFASQVKAIIAGGSIETDPSPAGWVGYYLWGHVPEPFTTFNAIESLAPGCILKIKKCSEPQISRIKGPIDYLRNGSADGDAPGSLHSILLDSVRSHLIADVPVGIFISAGIDSGVISALANETDLKEPLRGITLGFSEYRDSQNDEVPLAVKTANHYGIQHTVRWVDRNEFENALPDFLASMDQPTTDGLNTWFVSKAAQEIGLKVALSGVGGDELFGGYPSFHQVPSAVRRLSWCPTILGRGFRWVSAPVIKHFTSPKYAGLLEYGGYFAGAYLLRRGMYMPWELPKLLDPEFVREGWLELNTMGKLAQTIENMPNDNCRVMALETQWYLQSRLLRDTDWTSMAHSLEVRTPLVDISLIGSLNHWLQNNGDHPTKRSLAQSPRNSLPSAIVDRPKTGFSIPVREWLLGTHREKANHKRGLRNWAQFIAKNYKLA